MRNFRCGECGSKNIQLKNAKGRRFAYKALADLELIYDLDLPTCMDCDNYILTHEYIVKLDEDLEKSLEQK